MTHVLVTASVQTSDQYGTSDRYVVGVFENGSDALQAAQDFGNARPTQRLVVVSRPIELGMDSEINLDSWRDETMVRLVD